MKRTRTNSRDEIPVASRLDSVRFLAFHLLPTYLEGMFLRRPFWVGVLGRFLPTPAAIGIYRRMRERYRSSLVFLKLPGRRRVLIVNDDETQMRVLNRSPDVYGSPTAKSRGMSVFQPNAVTIAVGKDWLRKRRFNCASIDRAEQNGFPESIEKTVREVTLRAFGKQQDEISWQEISRVFERISRHVILGKRAVDDERLTEDLRKMMRRANWLFLRPKEKDLTSLLERIFKYADLRDPHSLVGHISAEGNDDMTVLEKCHQVPHWMFAMTDTLAETATRALAMISSQYELVEQIRLEQQADRESTLKAAVSETTRLYPSTPTLGRKAVTADVLADEMIWPGVQVLTLVDGWNRDPNRFEAPSRFTIPRQSEGQIRNLAFGGGKQVCAGEALARKICIRFLDETLLNFEVELRSPGLNPNGTLPYRLNPFRLEFRMTDRG